jgi:hypothetical protein
MGIADDGGAAHGMCVVTWRGGRHMECACYFEGSAAFCPLRQSSEVWETLESLGECFRASEVVDVAKRPAARETGDLYQDPLRDIGGLWQDPLREIGIWWGIDAIEW